MVYIILALKYGCYVLGIAGKNAYPEENLELIINYTNGCPNMVVYTYKICHGPQRANISKS